VTVTFDSTGLAPGNYGGDLVVYEAERQRQAQVVVPVTLRVLGPDLSVDPEWLQAEQAPDTQTTQDIRVANVAGDEWVDWSISESPDLPWLDESPASGTLPPFEFEEVEITFDSTGLTPGEYTGDLLVASASPGCPVITVPVTLTVVSPDQVMFVRRIRTRYREREPGVYLVQAAVLIIEEGGDPVVGAAVAAEWTKPNGRVIPAQRSTRPSGWASFGLSTSQPGTYQFCVVDVGKDRYIYDPDQNWQTCQDIEVP
jgi:hypothetical protein